MFEEGFLNEKTKKYLIIGIVSIVVLVVVLLWVKIFIIKPPSQFQLPPLPPTVKPGSPEEAGIRYLQWEQEAKRTEAEKYLHPFALVKLFGEKYQDIQAFSWSQPEDKKGSQPVYQVKESKIEGLIAYVTIEETTNKKEGSLFLGFILPPTITFEITLVKFQNQWRIIEINSPDLLLESKIGERTKIKDNVFVKLIKIEEYTPKEDIAFPEKKEFKFLSLNLEYENKSDKSISFQPFSEWKIISMGATYAYNPLSLRVVTSAPLNPALRKPVAEGGELNVGAKVRGYVSFAIPKDVSIKEIIFQNLEKKIILPFPQKLPIVNEKQILELQR